MDSTTEFTVRHYQKNKPVKFAQTDHVMWYSTSSSVQSTNEFIGETSVKMKFENHNYMDTLNRQAEMFEIFGIDPGEIPPFKGRGIGNYRKVTSMSRTIVPGEQIRTNSWGFATKNKDINEYKSKTPALPLKVTKRKSSCPTLVFDTKNKDQGIPLHGANLDSQISEKQISLTKSKDIETKEWESGKTDKTKVVRCCKTELKKYKTRQCLASETSNEHLMAWEMYNGREAPKFTKYHRELATKAQNHAQINVPGPIRTWSDWSIPGLTGVFRERLSDIFRAREIFTTKPDTMTQSSKFITHYSKNVNQLNAIYRRHKTVLHR